EPWFPMVFLDNANRAIGVAVDDSADVAEVQARLDDELGDGVTRVGTAPNTDDELAAAQAAATSYLQDLGIRYAGTGGMSLLGVVSVDLEVLDAEVIDGLAAAVPPGSVCVKGADPADVVPEGPQPQE